MGGFCIDHTGVRIILPSSMTSHSFRLQYGPAATCEADITLHSDLNKAEAQLYPTHDQGQRGTAAVQELWDKNIPNFTPHSARRFPVSEAMRTQSHAFIPPRHPTNPAGGQWWSPPSKFRPATNADFWTPEHPTKGKHHKAHSPQWQSSSNPQKGSCSYCSPNKGHPNH